PQGYQQAVPTQAEQILEALKKNKGFLPLTDKSDPDEVASLLKMSKKAFKKAVGALYKQRLIRLEEAGIYLEEGDSGQ
nr:GntR family transcriptional regulator [Saprospiraceae bacterium]